MLYATSPLRPHPDGAFACSPSSRIAYDGESLVFGTYSSLSSAFYAHSSRSYRESSLRDTSSPTPSETLTFIADPTENALTSPFKPTASSIPSHLRLPSRSPADTNIARPITQLSPSTPFQNLFASSPTGFWHPGISSVSPVLRNQSSEDLRAKKIRSLAEYNATQETRDMTGSPSSSLSSVPSSPADDSPGRPLSSLLASALARSSLESNTGFDRRLPAPVVSSALKTQCGAPYMRTYIDQISESRYHTRARTRLVNSEIPERKPSQLNLSGPDPSAVQTDDFSDDPTERRRTSRKRALQDDQRTSPSRKKSRSESSEQENAPEETVALSQNYPRRTFPQDIPIHEEFPLFYRRFPVSSYSKTANDSSGSLQQLSDAIYNPPRGALDLYTPRYVKGRGVSKVGLCPCCCESTKRGGEGRKLWLSMKFSAFNYHMQYAHGISVVSGRPFSPPTAFRVIARHHVGKHEKTSLMQGKCHKCQQWVAIEGIKDVPTKVKEIYWWKHAAACHQGSIIEGEDDIYVEDTVYRALLDAEAEESDGEDE
ncbi:hypothetical protein B0H21DRAFT_742779 [Amylocystis lapponica]|nr:hypothetical protein B0H21DRAFT_742779 [Amylocystis lapponica]